MEKYPGANAGQQIMRGNSKGHGCATFASTGIGSVLLAMAQ